MLLSAGSHSNVARVFTELAPASVVLSVVDPAVIEAVVTIGTANVADVLNANGVVSEPPEYVLKFNVASSVVLDTSVKTHSISP